MEMKRKRKAPAPTSEDHSPPSCSSLMTGESIDDEASIALFERIYSGTVLPKLPNSAWAIHCSPQPIRRIVASELRVCVENMSDVAPLYIKQIIFDQKLNFEVFFVNTKTVLRDRPNIPQTMEEIEYIITYISGVKICTGGPAVSEFNNVNVECAYKDPTDKWRHNLCSLETVDENVCKSCFSLEEVLQRHVQRNKLSGKSVLSTRKKKRVGLRRSKHV